VIWVLMVVPESGLGGGTGVIPGLGVHRPARWGTVVYAHEPAS